MCVCVCVCVCVSDFFLSIHLSMDVFSDTLIIVNNTIVNVGVLKKKTLGSTVVKNLPANAGDTEIRVQSLGQEDFLQ